MQVIDVNTSFGKRVDDDPRFTAPALADELAAHQVACAFTYSQQGVEYDQRAGNAETIATCKALPGLFPVGTLDPRDPLCMESEIDRCLKGDVRALRFFPGSQGWSAESALFQQLLRRLRGTGLCVIVSSAECQVGPTLLRGTAEADLPLILTDVWYHNMAEIMAVMEEFRQVHAETNWLATVGAVDIMADAVGHERMLYGSSAPTRPMQKALNEILESDLPDAAKEAILGGNAMRLFRISKDDLAGRPRLTGHEPARFAEPIIDVHSHLGYWRAPIRDEDYDPSPMIRRMEQFGISHSIVSSYESMRYDIAAGNCEVAAAIEGHPELRGYVEVNPHQLQLSCKEMDRYYRQPNFIGAEVELSHIPCPTASEKVRALVAEIARRGRPVLFLPANADDAAAERALARGNPGLTIIHAHGFDKTWAAVVADTPNICVEFCLSRASHHNVRDCLDMLGAKRILFGSDQTLLSVGAAVGLYLDARLDAEERKLVLHDNARRIFNL